MISPVIVASRHNDSWYARCRVCTGRHTWAAIESTCRLAEAAGVQHLKQIDHTAPVRPQRSHHD